MKRFAIAGILGAFIAFGAQAEETAELASIPAPWTATDGAVRIDIHRMFGAVEQGDGLPIIRPVLSAFESRIEPIPQIGRSQHLI